MSRYLLIIVHLLFSILRLQSERQDQLSYPPLWHEVPSSWKDFPLINQTRVIDPWFYPHRLGLYRILIEITTPLMPFCSSSNASNILFALPSQFGWQFESNRLFTNGTLTISPISWWASANYYLSVIPFLAAIDVGLIPCEPFRLLKTEDFCTTISECFDQVPRAMNQWQQFFSRIREPIRTVNDQIIDQYYLGPMWSANIASIENALPLIERKLDYLPSSVERLFGFAWSRLINLIGMTRKNTNLIETLKNQRSFLPRRMLVEHDLFSRSNDLPDPVHRSLTILFSFHFEWLTLIEKIWMRITCNYQGRLYAQQVLETMATSKFIALKSFSRALISTVLFQCDRPWKNDL